MLLGWEWIIVGVVVIVIILWGPSKIPQLAKALGRVKGEFTNGTKEYDDAAKNSPQTLKSKDELLVETAQKLGISTTGKTREQLTQEISMKVDLLTAD